jgi:hypothetical protein
MTEPSLISAAMNQGAVPDGYKPIDEDWHEFKNVGDEIHGQLLQKDQVSIGGNRVGRYTIMTPQGKRTAFLGSFQLDSKLAQVKQLSNIIIRYIGVQKTAKAGYEMKLFDVWVK